MTRLEEQIGRATQLLEQTLGTFEDLQARIGKAYAEGLPLPGEVGRCSRIGIPPSPEFEDWIQHVTEYHHSGLLIALRREEEK